MDALTQYITTTAETWTIEFVQDSISKLRARKSEVTGDLVRSLIGAVLPAAGEAAATIAIQFDSSGRFIDMRRMKPPAGGREYVEEIMIWLERKGLAEKFIQGYLESRKLIKRPEDVLRYVAFGIVKKRAAGKYRRKAWYNKSKEARIRGVGGLYNSIAANMPDEVAQMLKAGLSTGLEDREYSSSIRALRGYAKGRGRE